MSRTLWTLALIVGLIAGAIGIWGLVENVGHLGDDSPEESIFWVALGLFMLAVAIGLTLLSQRRG